MKHDANAIFAAATAKMRHQRLVLCNFLAKKTLLLVNEMSIELFLVFKHPLCENKINSIILLVLEK